MVHIRIEKVVDRDGEWFIIKRRKWGRYVGQHRNEWGEGFENPLLWQTPTTYEDHSKVIKDLDTAYGCNYTIHS